MLAACQRCLHSTLAGAVHALRRNVSGLSQSMDLLLEHATC